MRNAILTGFEPFGDYRDNPTQDIVRELDGRNIGGLNIRGIVLPCTYFGAFQRLQSLVDDTSSEIVLSMGLASSVGGIRIETTGINIMNGKYQDADGYKPEGLPIIQGGPEKLQTHSDTLSIVRSLEEAGLRTEVSQDAEGFICNSFIYLTALHLRERVKSAFIHIPWTGEYRHMIEGQPGKITIEKSDVIRAVEIILANL